MKNSFLMNASICLCMMVCSCFVGQAQDSVREGNPHWYLGVMGGYRFGGASISDLDKDFFPDAEGRNSGMFSLFVQYEWGRESQFAVRPELTFLNRGVELPGIGKEYMPDDMDIRYTLKSKYIDIRVPLIYNIGKYAWNFRPYVYVAPTLGFSTGGYIDLNYNEGNGAYSGYSLDLTDANMASTYLGAAVGAGVKYGFKLRDTKCYVSVEADYEFGLTNTYSKKERDGEVIINSGMFYPAYDVTGSRKFQGFELRMSLSVPFDIFKKKKKQQRPAPVEVVETPAPMPKKAIVAEPKTVVDEKPCYSLEEILSLISMGERVEGKTICAVNMIHFDFGKSTIQANSHGYLDKIASLMIRTGIKMEIKGHTDNVGKEDFNMNLSEERAKAVYDYLVRRGVNKSNLSYSYYGMTRPLGSNDTEEGRMMNRRVEFEIK